MERVGFVQMNRDADMSGVRGAGDPCRARPVPSMWVIGGVGRTVLSASGGARTASVGFGLGVQFRQTYYPGLDSMDESLDLAGLEGLRFSCSAAVPTLGRGMMGGRPRPTRRWLWGIRPEVIGVRVSVSADS